MAVVAGIGLGSIAGLWLFYGRIGAWAVRTKAIPRVEAKLGHEVDVDSIDVDRDRVVLSGVAVLDPRPGHEPLVRVESVTVEYEMWPTVKGRPVFGAMSVEGVSVRLEREADGTSNADALLAALRGSSDDAGSEGDKAAARRGPRPTRIDVAGGSVLVVDRASGARLEAELDTAAVVPDEPLVAALRAVRVDSGFGPKAGAETLQLRAYRGRLRESLDARVGGGFVELWRGMSLTGIAGTVRPEGQPGRVIVDLAGGYGGVEGTLWTARGWVAPETTSGVIDLEAERFTFNRLRPILEGTPVQDFDETSVDVAMRLRLDRGNAQFDGTASLTGLTVFHPALSDEPVADLGFVSSVAGSFDRESRTLTVAEAKVKYRDVVAQIDAFLRLPGGVDPQTWERRTRPRVGFHLVVPPVTCQRALEAIPAPLAPKLQGFRLRGKFDADINVDVDWADLEATELGGRVGIHGCRVLDARDEVDAEKLLVEFDHRVLVGPDDYKRVKLGESNPDFVYLEDVSPHLINAHLTTEDSRFLHHKGFIGKEFRSALVRNLTEGYFKYGASSITMQTVKNIWLYRDKLLSRKLQELFLSWYIETQLEKERILEIYVNAIEYGPGIYGIGRAARYYFDKHPSEITPSEAVFFTSLLPSPRGRHEQYCKNELTKWTARKLDRVLDLMVERDRLTELERSLAGPEQVVFAHPPDFEPAECAEKVLPWEDARAAELAALAEAGDADAAAQLEAQRERQKKRGWWYRREGKRIVAEARAQAQVRRAQAAAAAAAAELDPGNDPEGRPSPVPPPPQPTSPTPTSLDL